MKRMMKYICGFAAAVLACSCGPKTEEQKVLGPEETVEAFYKAVSCGDFAAARELCDTVSMSGYLEKNESNWERMIQMDSTIASIAGELLSSAAVEIGNVTRDGEHRLVHYSIDAVMGMKKDKIATVKKEEGVWKVETITDAR